MPPQSFQSRKELYDWLTTLLEIEHEQERFYTVIRVKNGAIAIRNNVGYRYMQGKNFNAPYKFYTTVWDIANAIWEIGLDDG